MDEKHLSQKIDDPGSVMLGQAKGTLEKEEGYIESSGYSI